VIVATRLHPVRSLSACQAALLALVTIVVASSQASAFHFARLSRRP
jgi:hypothetical protein